MGSGQRPYRGWCAAGWRGRGGRCGQWRLGRGQFAETLLSVRVPPWRRGLVSEPQELRQISPAIPEGRPGEDRRGHAKGSRRHGELKREGHGCQTPTWRGGGGVGGGGGPALKSLGRGRRARLLLLDTEMVDRAGEGSLWLAEACKTFLLPPKADPYQDRPLLYPFHHFLSLLWSCFSPGSA